MKHTHQRNIKIIDELMNFCYKYNCEKIDISIITKQNESMIMLSAKIENLTEELLSYVRESFNTPRHPEMEEYFWSLTGDNDTDMELSLVGMMVDEAYVNYFDEQFLEIVLKRKI